MQNKDVFVTENGPLLLQKKSKQKNKTKNMKKKKKCIYSKKVQAFLVFQMESTAILV